jgi:hypothetical protein
MNVNLDFADLLTMPLEGWVALLIVAIGAAWTLSGAPSAARGLYAAYQQRRIDKAR